MTNKFTTAAVLPFLLLASVGAQQPITYVDADITAHTPDDLGTPLVDERMPGVITGNTFFAEIDATNSGSWTVRDFGIGGNLLQASGSDFGEISTTISGLDAGTEYNVYAFFWSNGSDWFIDTSLEGPLADASRFTRSLRSDASALGPVFEAATLNITNKSTPDPTTGDQIEGDFPLPLSRSNGATNNITLIPGLDSVNADNFVSDDTTPRGDQNLFAVKIGIASADSGGEVAAYIRNIAGGDRVWYDGLGYQEFDNITLTVDVGSGKTTLGNRSAFSKTLEAYQITSAAGSLDTGWNGISDDVSNWARNTAGATSNTLAEATDLDPDSNPLTLTQGDSFDLGNAFIPGAVADLEFTFLNAGTLREGDVRYVLGGDYNNDGVVDAADYTVWRDNEGAPAGTLPNDFDGGVIGEAQYQTWVANYGATILSAPATAVPEPTGLLLLLTSSLVIGPHCRCR